MVIASKPNSLMEHEISMLAYLQNVKHQKSTKLLKTPGEASTGDMGEEEEDEVEEEGVHGSKDIKYQSDVGTSATSLDLQFITSFLSGDTCLRGVHTSCSVILTVRVALIIT